MKRNISKDERKQMYLKVQTTILNDADIQLQFQDCGITISAATYTKIFDTQPLYSATSLLPFAVKVSATRNYKLINADDITDSSTLVMPTRHIDNEDVEETTI